MTALLVVTTLFSSSGCAIGPRDVRRAMVGERDIAYQMLGVGQPVIVTRICHCQLVPRAAGPDMLASGVRSEL